MTLSEWWNLCKVLTNSKFGLFYSNFFVLTPTFSKAQLKKYGKNSNCSGRQHIYSFLQNPCENSALEARPSEQCGSQSPGFEVIKLFSCSTQLSMKLILLINVKMPTIVSIWTFINMINTTSERLKARNFFICQYFSFYEQIITTQCFYRFFGDFDWSVGKIKWFLYFNKNPCIWIFVICLDFTVLITSCT